MCIVNFQISARVGYYFNLFIVVFLLSTELERDGFEVSMYGCTPNIYTKYSGETTNHGQV